MPETYQCANCGWRGPFEQMNDIHRYWERVDDDDDVEPDGECPKCGALAYAIEAEDA